ncbi:MAG: hypothetical protein HY298_17440 [Verrucomicrobia bacterium]|nr:hypothetical protein [Verrucomicrobiota bacterium]
MNNSPSYNSTQNKPGRSSIRMLAMAVVLGGLNVLISAGALAAAPPFVWATTALPATNAPVQVQQHGNAVAIDAAGNSYVAGNFFGPSVTFGTNAPGTNTPGFPNTLYSQGSSVGNTWDNEMYVAKYDNVGNLLWFHRGGGENNDSGNSVAVDASGNCYVIGSFNGTNVTFDGTATVYSSQNPTVNDAFGGTSDGADIFLIKYDTLGNLQWVRQGGGALLDSGSAVDVDASGNVYITGGFRSTATFGTNVLTSYGGQDIFVAKYDSAGNVIWVKQAGGVDGSGFPGERGMGVTADNAGNVYISGTVMDSGAGADFGTNHVTTPDLTDDFVAKYDSVGNCLWVVIIPTQSPRECVVSHDAAGNVYVSGRLTGSSTVGAFTISSAGAGDVFRLKLDSAGNAVWYKAYGGAADEAPFWSTTDAAGNGYAAGYVSGNPTDLFGTTTSHATTGRDVFVLKTDKDGNVVWAKEALGSPGDTGYGVAVNANGNIAVSGYLVDLTTFDSQTAYGLPNGTSGYVTHINDNDRVGAVAPPVLSITHSGNQVTISWPLSVTGFTLETRGDVASGLWTPVGGVVNNSVTFTAGSGSAFYRLRQ